jgi:predicted CoA-binding protein
MSTKSVAIVGASADRSKFGNKSVRAHAAQGWDVYPIHPKAKEIEGHRAYAKLADVPEKIDRVSLYVPAEIGLELLEEIEAIQPEELFVNPGAESDDLIEEARRRGLDPIMACSIVDVGVTPGAFSD